MKCLVILLISLSAILVQTERIVINTKSDEHIYNFFPLCTNYLEFSVKARNDVHVILTNAYEKGYAFYECVIGGWSNSRSGIRKDNDNFQAAHDGAIITNDVFQTFWVSINDTDQSITVGKERGRSFLHFRDPDYVKMSYFGISTGYGSPGVWNFDFDLLHCKCST